MPYAPHYKVTLSGILGTVAKPVEIWSTGFALSSFTSANPAGWEQSLFDALGTFWGGTQAGVGGTAILTEAKISAKGPSGLDTAPPVIRLYGSGVIPAADSQSLPLQVATVLSLNAASATRKAKGRMYLPAPTHAVDPATGTFVGTGAGSVAESWAGFFHQVNQISGEAVSVASSRDGLNHAVTAVRAGNVPGIVRRRRNGLDETYYTATTAI